MEDFEINDLSEVYKGMNKDGRKKMVMGAGKLLTAQKILENENKILEEKDKKRVKE
jgi:hypothetical protein